MPLGCLKFSHPHQQKTAEVVFKSCTHPHTHWWLWDSAHSTSLINVSSWYACKKASISLHWLASKRSSCISVCLAWVVGVFTSFNLSLFNRTSSWNAKSGSEPLPLADFALDNATNRVPGFFASNWYFPGWVTTYQKASLMPTVS